MEIPFSEKISPQLSAALLSTPYELGKEGGLSSGYLPESDSWEVIVKYVGDIEKNKRKSILFTNTIISSLIKRNATKLFFYWWIHLSVCFPLRTNHHSLSSYCLSYKCSEVSK